MVAPRLVALASCLSLAGALLPGTALAAPDGRSANPTRERREEAPRAEANRAPLDPELAAACAKLDDPKLVSLMDGLLLRLAIQCDRQDLLGQVVQEADEPAPDSPLATDARVNNVTGETGSRTQNETSLAYNASTGTLCSSFNDAYSGVVLGTDYTGFSRSIDGGATWSDRGAVHPTTGTGFGDPALVWRKSDGKFYEATLHSSGLGFWRSDDDCQTLTYVGLAHSGASDDKELLAVDNNPSSPYYGRIYLMWTDFSVGSGQIKSRYTTDGGVNWTTPITIGTVGAPQGVWPVVAPDGTVYATWIDRASDSVITAYVVKSTNGGTSFSTMTSPAQNVVNPRDSASSSFCGRPALNGHLRYLPSPQIAVGPDGVVHVVYSRDPNAQNTGDVIDVYYKRSIDGGTSWSSEVRLNDDATTNDQFFPAISIGASNIVTAGWYDRREDGSNLRLNYYTRTSYDGGITWQANAKVTDVDSPVVLDGGLATCYHGDYDTHVQTPTQVIFQWGDDRDSSGGGNNADTYTDSTLISTDFLVQTTPRQQTACGGSDPSFTVNVPSFLSFVNPVTMSATGLPPATTALFAPNPVTPGNSTTFTVQNTGASSTGSYPIHLDGSANAGAIHHTDDVILDLYVGVPAAPTAISPANGATGVAQNPTLTWSALGDAQSYVVEVATDAGFSSLVDTGTPAGTSYTVATVLSPETLYYWRVRGTNACGGGGNSSTFSFTVRRVPPILLVDDDDNLPEVRAAYTTMLDALGLGYDTWDTGHSDNEPLAGHLANYRAVVWFTGHSLNSATGPSAASETALGAWLAGGGRCFLISSQDYHYARGLTGFMTGSLGAASIVSDTKQNTATGHAGTVFAGLGPYAVTVAYGNFTDSMTAGGAPSEAAFDGNLGPAIGTDRTIGTSRGFYFSFPMESLADEKTRYAILRAAWMAPSCEVVLMSDDFELGTFSRWSATAP
ncbi:MAG: hypothetical protein U0X73_09570 [Thermoanaerobaculia bacterium]